MYVFNNFFECPSYRLNAWFIGPEPCPKSSMAANAPEIYSFDFCTDSASENPLERLDAIALDNVQPVPCVLGLFIRLPLNHVISLLEYKINNYW